MEFSPGEAIAPSTIDVESSHGIWPAREVRAEALPLVITDLADRTKHVPAGPWPVAPNRALVVPLRQEGHEKPAGFLVAGISSYRPFDSDYRGFIQLLGGQITAALSSVRAYQAKHARAEAPGKPVSRTATGSKPRLLLASNKSDMRDYVIRLLRADYDIEAVTDGEAALAEACAHRPDLIIADVRMPKLDGLQLLRRLRAESTTQTLPVILLSARAGEEKRIEGLKAGADDYLIKPFKAAELKARIAGLLAISPIRRDADLTLRKTAEERQKFAALVENSQNFIAMASLDGDINYMNPAGRALIGLGARDDTDSHFPSRLFSCRGARIFRDRRATETSQRRGLGKAKSSFSTCAAARCCRCTKRSSNSLPRKRRTDLPGDGCAQYLGAEKSARRTQGQ